MPYALLADLAVVLHAAFVVFVLFGAMVALKWPWIVRLHLPAAAWGALIEFSGWPCPLTPLENWFRKQAGIRAYDSDFVSHYLLPILYPSGLTRGMQFVFGSIVLIMNGALYTLLWWRRHTTIGRSE